MEVLVLGFWLICGVGAAMIAHSKGFDGCGWFVGGILFGPVALLVVGFMAPATNIASTNTAVTSITDFQSQRVKCPYCAELIMPDAKICRFCGRDVEPVLRTSAASPSATEHDLDATGLVASVSSEPRGESGMPTTGYPDTLTRGNMGAKKFYRSQTDKMIAGVCGGLGQYLNIDPTLIRLIFALLAILGVGSGIVLYIILMIVVPLGPESGTPPEPPQQNS